MTTNASTRAWLILLALTALSAGLAETHLPGAAVLVPVLLATLIKGRIVIDAFMELRHAAAMWRWIVFGWLITVVGLIAFAFRISPI
ncbi:MAG TPA: cytochrome C oxidase subunit IV family protein [Noviherbaspirillum sp.]|nr:cytochrome C oxidase subunit IV family protein [Noviherbaspirillum sp.]